MSDINYDDDDDDDDDVITASAAEASVEVIRNRLFLVYFASLLFFVI